MRSVSFALSVAVFCVFSVVGIPGAVSADKMFFGERSESKGPERWEYKSIAMSMDGRFFDDTLYRSIKNKKEETSAFLSKLGAEGWELISVVTVGIHHSGALYTFRRKL